MYPHLLLILLLKFDFAGDELLTDSRHTTGSNGDLSSTLRGNDCPPDADTEDAEEKARLICQVLELQNTLDGKLA